MAASTMPSALPCKLCCLRRYCASLHCLATSDRCFSACVLPSASACGSILRKVVMMSSRSDIVS